MSLYLITKIFMEAYILIIQFIKMDLFKRYFKLLFIMEQAIILMGIILTFMANFILFIKVMASIILLVMRIIMVKD